MNEQLTLVLLPSAARTAREILIELSSHQLLRPFVLVDEQGDAVTVTDGLETSVSLSEYLSRRTPAMIRLVNVAPTTVDAAPAPFVDELWLKLSRQCVDAGIEFAAIGVAVGTKTDQVDSAAFAKQFNANIVLVPEDGGGSRGMIAVPLDADRVELAAAHAATVVGALWAWMEAGPFDNEPGRLVEDVCYVRLARLTSRVIDAGDVTARIVGWALSSEGAWPVPDGTIAHGDAPLAVERLVATTAERLGFRFNPVEPPTPNAPEVLSIFGAYKAWIRLVGDAFMMKLSSIAAGLEERVATTIEGHVQRQTFGEDSDVLVRIGGVPRPGDAMAGTMQRINLLASLPGIDPPSPMPTPQTWRELAAIAFAAVDGGRLPTGMSDDALRWQGLRGVLLNRSMIVPAPDPAFGTGFHLARSDFRSLGFEGAAADDRVVAGGGDVFTARSVESFLRLAAAPVGTPVPAPEPSTEALTDEPPPNERAVRFIDDLIIRFEDWRRAREGSFMWRLGVQLADAISTSLDDVAGAQADLEQLERDFAEYRIDAATVVKRRRRRVILTAVAIPLLLLASYLAYRYLYSRIGLILALAGVICSSAVPLSIVPVVREQRRLESRLRRLMQRLEWLPRRRNHAVAEAVRLASLNDQLREWTDILAQSIHHPWMGPEVLRDDATWNGDSGLLALTGGVADLDPEELQGQISRVRRSLCRPGWLQAAYLEVRRHWQARYLLIAGLDPTAQNEPEADHGGSRLPFGNNPITGEHLYAPRVQFQREVMERRHAATVGRAVALQCRSLLTTTDTRRLISTVRCPLPGLDGVTADDFLRSLVEFSPVPSFNHQYLRRTLTGTPSRIETSHVALTAPTTFRTPQDETARAMIPTLPLEGRHVLGAIRLDVTEALPKEDFLLVRADPSDEHPTALPGILQLDLRADRYDGIG